MYSLCNEYLSNHILNSVYYVFLCKYINLLVKVANLRVTAYRYWNKYFF